MAVSLRLEPPGRALRRPDPGPARRGHGPADGPRLPAARGRRGRRGRRHQRPHRARRRVELARGRAADDRLRDPRVLVLRVRGAARRPSGRATTTAREGCAHRRGRWGRAIDQAAASSGSASSSSLGSPGLADDLRALRDRLGRRRLAERLGLGRQATRRPAGPRSPSSCGPTASRRARRRSRSSSAGRRGRRPTSGSGAGPRWRPAGPCRGTAGDLREPIPRDDGAVLGLLLAAPEELVAGHGERRDVLAAGQAAHLRVAREAPREEDLVHGPISFPVGRSHRSRPCVCGGQSRRAEWRSAGSPGGRIGP